MNTILTFLVLATTCYGFTCLNYSNNIESVTESQTVNSVQSIQNNNVYFIRSYADDSKAFDVTSGNYSSGTNVILYSATNMANQRFIFRQSDDYHWYIIPQYDVSDLFLTVSGGSSSDNTNVILKGATYTSSMMNANRFLINYNSSYGAFTIRTGNTSYSSYLSYQQNGSLTNIVQKAAPQNGLSSSFYWKIVKTDGYSVNTKKYITVSANSYSTFNLKVSKSLPYVVVSKTTASSRLYLYSSNNTLLCSGTTNSSGHQQIIYNFSNNSEYKIKFYNDTSSSQSFYLSLYPEKESYFYTYYSPNDLDTTGDITYQYSKFENNNYYLHHVNNGGSGMLCSATNTNGLKSINNQYFNLSSHGNDDGSVLLSPSTYIYPSDLPDMNNVTVALWATCFSGINNGIAETSIDNGAEYSIGWPGLGRVETSNIFINHFWENVFNNQSIENAFSNAKSFTLSSTWYLFYVMTHQTDSINNLTLFRYNNTPLTAIDNTYSLCEYRKMAKVENTINRDYELIEENDCFERYVKTIMGHLTNDFIIRDKITGECFKSYYSIKQNSNVTIYGDACRANSNKTILSSDILYANDGIKTKAYLIEDVVYSVDGLNRYDYECFDLENHNYVDFRFVVSLFSGVKL